MKVVTTARQLFHITFSWTLLIYLQGTSLLEEIWKQNSIVNWDSINHIPKAYSFLILFLEVKGAGCMAGHPNFPFKILLGSCIFHARACMHVLTDVCMQVHAVQFLFFSHFHLYPISFCNFADWIYAALWYSWCHDRSKPKLLWILLQHLHSPSRLLSCRLSEV